jgi:hypothetical protein
LIIGKISEAENLDINPEDITGEFQSILDNHFGEDEKARTDYMQSGDSVALLNRVSSQVITKKTLDFLMAIAQGNDLTPFLKKEEEDPSEEEPVDPEMTTEAEEADQPQDAEETEQTEQQTED